jgi:uncharacterized protein (DUF1810 family)
LPANSEIEDIYEALNTRGWHLLCKRFEEQFEAVNQVVGCNTEKDIFVRQGQLMMLQELLMLKDAIADEMNESTYPKFEEAG